MSIIQSNTLFPKCSGAVWLEERGARQIPRMEGSPLTYNEPIEKSHFVSGYCMDIAKELKALQEKQLPGTNLNAKGIVLISNSAGVPILEHRFGEAIVSAITTDKSWSSWFKSFLPIFRQYLPAYRELRLQNLSTYPNLIKYFECASFVPTESGLLKASQEFSLYNSQLVRLF